MSALSGLFPVEYWTATTITSTSDKVALDKLQKNAKWGTDARESGLEAIDLNVKQHPTNILERHHKLQQI
jgi:hypothetical protein